MQPNDTIIPYEINRFWKDKLFDFGFSPRVIEIAATYDFRWGDIIPDLFLGKFGPRNQHFSNALPPSLCEQTLSRLLALALHEGHDQVLMNQLNESLKRVGFDWSAMSSEVDSSGPAEPARVSTPAEKKVVAAAQHSANVDVPGKESILVLISHSSKDAVLAEALINLLRSGLGLLASQIRCSSVDGYRLPAGVNTGDKLRKEIKSVNVLIGLLTPNSLSSTYVLFELGARWGAELFMIPLLAGIKPDEMHGPHSVLNALSCETEAQLIQLVEDIGRELSKSPQSAASYMKEVRAVKELAGPVRSTTVSHLKEQEGMVFEESVYWRRKNGEREGPYCPVCYDHKHKVIHLIAGATTGTYQCGTCRNEFRTAEYDPNPGRRRHRKI
jgi:hypothetical protein